MRLIILLFFISIGTAFSQKTWNILGNVGIIQNITKYPLAIQSARVINGWYIGTGIRYYKNRFYLNSELNFAIIDLQANPKFELFEDRPTHNTLALPIRIGYDIFRNEDFKLRAQAGFNTACVLNTDDRVYKLMLTDYRRVRFGAQIGAGIDFYPIAIDYHFELGLNPTYDGHDFKTNGHIFTLGILFR